jgi:hypothetical protein
VKACVQRLVRNGLLIRDGYWHRLLQYDALPLRGSRLYVWTGFLVRPTSRTVLRVGPAFNRRSRLSVVEHAIADSNGFTPLIVEVDTRDLASRPRWVDAEIGCILPLATGTRMTLTSIQSSPDVASSVEDFFDVDYFRTKQSKPTGKYRKVARIGADAPPVNGLAKVVYAGPGVHSLSRLRRFHHPKGLTPQAPLDVALPFCTIRNVAAIEASWDGQTFTRQQKVMKAALRSLRSTWLRAGGRANSDAYEFLSGYFFGPSRDEPYWQLQPWVFSVTEAGWSTVVDGANLGGCDGMRGIIRTDIFHPVSMVYRMYAPGDVVLPPRAPLMRIYPAPRDLQDATVRMIDEIDAEPSRLHT